MKKIRITSSDKLRLVSVILSLVMVFVMIPKGIVRADSGNCGPGLSWDFNGGVLTISGSGDMYDYPEHLHGPDSGNELAQPWFHLKPYINSIVINEGVTSIGAGAFWGCGALTSVSIPGSVQRIGFAAFADDGALGSVTIPNGVIGEMYRSSHRHIRSRRNGFGNKRFRELHRSSGRLYQRCGVILQDLLRRQ